MFDRILVPLDGSQLAECVLPHASAIAQSFDAQVDLLRLLDRSQVGEQSQLFDLVNWQINKTAAKLYIERTATRLEKLKLQVQSTLMEGMVAESIVEFAQHHGSKLIILSTHGRSGYSPWGISGTTQKVIFSAPASVLIIRAQQPGSEALEQARYSNILLPLDGSLRAENVLPMAALFARTQKSHIHIAHVVRPPEMARQLPVSHEDAELAQKIVDRNQEEASRYLDQIKQQSQLTGIEVQSHLLVSDDPASRLHELIEKENIDLVALSAHGYSGNHQWPYGSMVNNFILYNRSPLLIIQDLPARDDSIATEAPARKLAEQ